VANGVAYIAGFDGKVSAFSTAGCGTPKCMPLWQGSTDNDITAAPAVGGGTLLVASADHFLYAFPAAGCGAPTCEPLWRGRLDGADVDSSVAVADGLAYVGTYDRGRLDAFAISGCGAAVCDPVWAGQGGGHLVTSPAIGDGSVFIGSDDGHLYVFPAAGCGAPRCAPSWTASLHGPAFSVAPTFADHTVFMGSRTLYAFDARGCGAPTCLALRSYDLDDAGLLGAPAVAGDLLFASTQSTPNPNTEGVVAAFPLHGCGAQLCEPLWTGINFGAGFESSPVAAGGLVFVAKGPASGFPVDAGLFAYDVHGCGSAVCDPLAFVQVGPDQFYLSSSPAVTGGQIMFGSGNNDDGTSDLYVLSLPGS
jgi:outer membrane protein assembly factor BamB